MSALHDNIINHAHNRNHGHVHQRINVVPPTPSIPAHGHLSSHHNPHTPSHSGADHLPQTHAHHRHHQHHHSHQSPTDDPTYSQWSLHIRREELEFLLIFQEMIPHIYSSPYHYELAVAPALGYERAKELSQSMVIPLDQNTFSYIAPDGVRHTGEIEKHHSHLICVELPSPLGNDFVMKSFVEQELPPNGDIP